MFGRFQKKNHAKAELFNKRQLKKSLILFIIIYSPNLSNQRAFIQKQDLRIVATYKHTNPSHMWKFFQCEN
jgi:hypothetical protein